MITSGRWATLVALALLAGAAAPASAGASPGPAGPAGEAPRVTVTEIPVPEGYRAEYSPSGERHRVSAGWVAVDVYGTAAGRPRRVLVRDPRGATHLLPAPAASARDVSRRGHVVGDADGTQAFVWRDGELTLLPSPDGLATAVAVNDRGQVAGAVAGVGARPPTEPTAAVWDRGRLVTLPDDRPSMAVDINGRGLVAVDLGPGVGAAVWRPGGGLTELGTLGGNLTSAVAINERGEVAGNSRTPDGMVHGFLWRDGRMIDLGTLGGETSRVVALNDRGHVVGSSRTADGHDHAFLWRDGQMIDLGEPEGDVGSRAQAVNDRDQVVGESFGAGTGSHAVLWQGGRIVDIGRLAADAGFDSAVPSAIDDRGHVVGSAMSASGTHALLWTVR